MADFNEAPEPYVPAPPPPVAASGLAPNIAGALAYVTVLPAILFLVLEPYNRDSFIRFNALQCIGLFICGFGTSLVMVIPILGWLIGLVMLPVLFIFWVLCIVNAYQGKKFKVPVIGQFVENMAK
jgi:uncharacterized membrane protein